MKPKQGAVLLLCAAAARASSVTPIWEQPSFDRPVVATPATQTEATETTEITADSSTCATCDGLNDKACLSALDAMVDAFSDKERLTFERAFDLDCTELSDKACLSALDEMRTTANDKTRLTMLKAACAADSLSTLATAPVVAGAVAADAARVQETSTSIAVVDEPSCSLCEGQANEQCLIKLESYVRDLSDKDRLSFERGFAEDRCDNLTDKECLSALDTLRTTAKSTMRLTLLNAACVAAGVEDESVEDASEDKADVDSLVTTQCYECTNLSNEQCLVKLDAYVQSLGTKARLAYELNYAEGDDCDPGDTTACLEALDAKRENSEDAVRLSLLLQACSSRGHGVKSAIDESTGVGQIHQVGSEPGCLLCGEESEEATAEDLDVEQAPQMTVPGADASGLAPTADAPETIPGGDSGSLAPPADAPQTKPQTAPATLAASGDAPASGTQAWAVIAPVGLVALAVALVAVYRRSARYQSIPEPEAPFEGTVGAV